jgi:hypothetical protein
MENPRDWDFLVILLYYNRKGAICDKLSLRLISGEEKAINRAKLLQPYRNPSTSVFLFIEELKKN